ncbi:MAG: hypothetical protein H0W81_06565 [Chloroflexi bacterium]|nr:hypothetical protein [Chloroflexota bacterium]
MLFVFPNSVRTGKFQVSNMRRMRVVGGHMQSTTAASSIRVSDLAENAWFEGLRVDNSLLDLYDAFNVYGRFSAHALGISFPNVYLINCLITGVHTSSVATLHPDIFQPQGPLGNLTLFNVTADSTYQGLFLSPQSVNGITPPATYGTLTLKRVNIKMKASVDAASNGGYAVWLLDHGAGGDSQVPYPVVLENAYIDMSDRPTAYQGLAAFGVWPHSGQSDAAWRAQTNGDGTVGYTGASAMSPYLTGVYRPGAPPAGDFVLTSEAGLSYVSPGYSGGTVGTITYSIRPAYSGSTMGTIFVDDARNGYNVQTFISGGGVANDTDNALINALDGYFPIYRTGSSPGGSPPTVNRSEFLRVTRQDPATASVGWVPKLAADGSWTAAAESGSTAFNNRGVIAASTAYAVGDTVYYTFQKRMVVITTAQTSNGFALLTAGTFQPLGVTSEFVNVKIDFGALGDGTTNDRAAIQAGIDFCNAQGGGHLYFPPGTYMVGTPGLVWPADCQQRIELRGSGMGMANATTGRETIIKRSASGYALITATGSGIGTLATDANVCNDVTISQMNLDGNGHANIIMDTASCAGMECRFVRFSNATHHGFKGAQLWNSSFQECRFEICGSSGSDFGAVLLTDRAAASSETNTVHFSACSYEANNWDDIVFDGATSPCTGVVLSNDKMERSGRYGLHFKSAQNNTSTGAYMYADKTGGACVKCAGGTNNHVTGTFVGGLTVTQMIQLTTGSRMMIKGPILAPSGATGIVLASGMGSASIDCQTTPGFPTTPITDSRTTKSGSIILNGRGTFYDGSVLKLKAGAVVDADFASTASDGTIAYDSTNNKLYVRSGGVWRSTVALT